MKDVIRLIGFALLSLYLLLKYLPMFIVAATFLATILCLVGLLSRVDRNPSRDAALYARLREVVDPPQARTVLGAFRAKRKSRNSTGGILLTIAAAAVYVPLLETDSGVPAWPIGFLLGGAAILICSQYLLVFRIEERWFGESDFEIRQILQFVIGDSTHGGFPGGLGERSAEVAATPQVARPVVLGGDR